ncbi:MAG: TonB-dependent receptor [Xanthomonadales bacterium]|nr:TonB-dependent receptor [Xanthomonadales bacterium]
MAAMLIAPLAGFAQDTTSAIRGNVVDHTGAVVSGAEVVIVDTRTGSRRVVTSNNSGAFLATNLAVGGPYTVTVSGAEPVTVDSIALGDIFNLSVRLQAPTTQEEVVVTGQSSQVIETATGPSATFSAFEMDTSVSITRDIVEVYTIDPRINLDNEDDGYAINCAGKHPRFNSVTLDGVSMNDRFGLNENGYSTAVGMPFPYDAIQQVAVELAPFDVTYGGFSACNVNAVTKTGANQWFGGVFYEYTDDDLRGDSIQDEDGSIQDLSTPAFTSDRKGFHLGGPIMKDKLFFFVAYEESEQPRFLAIGYAGENNGVERPWMSMADYNRIDSIAKNLYNYDPGGSPRDGSQEAEKYMVRLDWNINDRHNAALIYNYFDGFQLRNSDGDNDEFEFFNHFYTKGAESETITAKLASQWTDAFSTEVFISNNTMNDSQVTLGPKDFGDHQISIGNNTVYLGADDSRQANKLNTESDFFKISAQYLTGNHVITAGFESEDLEIFNQFVQHSNGGEWDYFDDSAGNPAHCAALSAQGRFEDPACGMSGIDKFELGRPSRIYYGSAGGTNNPDDAAANFTNTANSVYIQDEYYMDDKNLTLVYGLRYDWFDSNDRPVFNQAFTDANGGLRNDGNIDGLDILMPRFGFTWDARDNLTVRGGIGLYSGGNPNVWLSNAWSNDGFSNVQVQFRNFSGSSSVFNDVPLSRQGRPGYDVPQALVDQVANTTIDSASTSGLVLIDPNYDQPSEWKMALGATWDTPWAGVVADIDFLWSRSNDAAQYVDLSQSIVGMTSAGAPIYNYTNGRDNYMLTNSPYHADSSTYSIVLRKDFDNGLDVSLGYAYSDAEDIVPMTSSTAGSNWDNVALIDPNDPRPATTNYLVPHRITLRASYGTEFFSDLETRFTVLGYNSEGQPQSYVMGSGDLEGDGFFGRHLLYVPDPSGDPNVVYAPGFDQAAFNQFVQQEGLEPGFSSRNGQHAKWTTRFDFRIDQELPFFGDARGKLFLKVYNLGNLLNDKWGLVNDAQFFSVQVVNSSVNSQGQYVFERFNNRTIEDLLENRSLYEIVVGLEFNF